MAEHHLLFSTSAASAEVTAQALEDALNAPGAPAAARSLEYLHTQEGDDTTIHLWRDETADAEVKLVEDRHLGCVYALISDDDAAAGALRDYLGGRFSTVSCQAVRDLAKRDMAAAPQLLVQLTLCGGAAEESDALILEGLAHPAAEVRRAAATAAALLRTPALIDGVDAALDEETDEQAIRLLSAALRMAGRE